jgi:hypothetical protein
MGFLLAALAFAALGAGACSSGKAPAPAGGGGGAGSLRMALSASANGRTYRLRQATFTVSGPTSTVLETEAQPDAPALTATLDVGSYTIQLGGSYFLERVAGSGPVRVAATLTSPNPAAFQITAGVTTGVAFQFSTDGTVVTIGTGSVSVTTQVNEVTGRLALLAGRLGGLGSGDGIGADGRFFEPTGIVGDGAGNLYVADTFNNTIRRIAIATLEVTTLAGTPTLSGADDGVGPAARFNSPVGPALDGAGNLYVADRFNNTIRKLVLATGEVTTFVGTAGSPGSADGIGAAAQLSDPHAVAGDGAGNLYVADGNVIRKIVIATRAVTTLAGGGSDPFGGADGVGAAASFSGPQGLTADGAGNLYVADTNDMTIRKVVIATGAVTTIAGLPHESGTADGVGTAARFSEPWAVTADGAGNLFVADASNNLIRQIVIATGEVTTLAGGMPGAIDGSGAGAAFEFPEGIASDRAGNVWVTDTDNAAIRKVVVATGEVTTPVSALFPFGPLGDGVGSAVSLPGVQAMASDGAGNLYFTENATVRKVVVATEEVTTVAGVADDSRVVDGTGAAVRFAGPRGLTFDAGVLYITDDNTVRRLVVATGEATTLAGAPGVEGSADGVGAAASFSTPMSVASDGAGNLYVADFVNGLIRRVEVATGAVTTIAGTLQAFTIADGVGPAASFFSPHALVHDGAGTLYLMDGTTLRRIVIATAEVTTLAGSANGAGSADGVGTAARFSLSDGLARDGAGNLFVADTQGHMIRKVVLSTLAVSTVVGNPTAFGVQLGRLPARVTLPESVAVLPDGSLAISDEAAILIATF